MIKTPTDILLLALALHALGSVLYGVAFYFSESIRLKVDGYEVPTTWSDRIRLFLRSAGI